jgi:hypothetical protein
MSYSQILLHIELPTHGSGVVRLADITICIEDSDCVTNSVLQQSEQRIPWDRVDKAQYHHLSFLYIEPLMDKMSEMDPGSLVELVNQALYRASIESLVRELPKKTGKRNRPWDATLKPFVTSAKLSHWKWKQSGKSISVEDPERQLWKQDKKALRSAQRQFQALDRKQKQQDIMDASSEDQVLFFKLVNKQRATGSQSRDEIEFSSQMLSGDQATCAWAEYFGQLATPKRLAYVRLQS